MSASYLRYAFAVTALLLASIATADQRSLRQGEYTVHYNAIPTLALGADMASRYDLTRSGSRGLLNVAVLRQRDGEDTATAVPARIQASSRSLIGQQSNIELRELRDQDAIYYIGQFRIRGEEYLRFELEVTPEGSERPIRVRFEHGFDGR